MLLRDEAVLLGWPVVLVPNGAEARTHSVEEFRYATEFNPPMSLSSWIAGLARSRRGASRSPRRWRSASLGSKLKVEAKLLQDGRVIDLTLDAQFVRFERMMEWRTTESPAGFAGVIQQPRFQAAKAQLHVFVDPDRPTLLSTFVVPGPEDRVRLFIVRARVMTLPPNAFQPLTPP